MEPVAGQALDDAGWAPIRGSAGAGATGVAIGVGMSCTTDVSEAAALVVTIFPGYSKWFRKCRVLVFQSWGGLRCRYQHCSPGMHSKCL